MFSFIQNKYFSFHALYIYSLFLLPVGLLFGEVPTSVAEIIVFILWLLSKNWKNIPQLKHSTFFWLLALLYFLHIIGLLYTTDFNYAFNDLRIKIPLLFFPLVLFTSNISHKQIILILQWFVLVVFINLSYLWLYHNFSIQPLLDARDVSLFISHIRLGLISSLGIVTNAYLIINHFSTASKKILFIFIGFITLFLMIQLGLITGVASVVITAFFAVIYMLIKKSNPVYLYIISAITLIFIVISLMYFQSIHKKYFPEIKTSTNNIQNNTAPYTENGYLVYTDINDTELKKQWEKRSNIPYEGKDKKNNELKYTLYRYLTSKGLTKDSTGLVQLTDEDIANIENGNPNYLYVKAGFLEKRIYELLQEYYYFKISGDPSGKTIAMRIFYWKLAWQIFMKHFWTGVGTGDVQKAFDMEYTHYPHIPQCMHLRSHQQILTFALTFGIGGLLMILLIILYPLFYLKNTNDFLLFYMFSIISILSFFTDDTLETQPGVTFYALFYTLLIKLCITHPE